MTKILSSAAAMVVALSLASCGSNDEAAQAPAATAADGAMMAEADTPFSAAEMQMNEKMMAAVGVDTGDTWAKKMIEHHQGAIDMSQIMLGQNPTPDVEKMTRMGMEKQQKDIEAIRKLIKSGTPNQESGQLYRPAMMDMHEKMMAATGANASETFMRKMLEHHRGAVTMSNVALQNGVSGAMRAQVQKTKAENQAEVAMVEAMLGGKSHDEAMAASTAQQGAQSKPALAPPEKTMPQARKTSSAPKVTPSAAKTASPTKTPAPAASKEACLPEHREAGHC